LIETLFAFPEGIQVLGVELYTNDADFWRDGGRSNGEIEWKDFYYVDGNSSSRSGDLDVLVRPSYVSIRPHIRDHTGSDGDIAKVFATFFVSVQAGFEHLYGEDIDLTATFRGGASGFGDEFRATETVALAWDPITVTTNPIQIQDNNEAAWGQIRQVQVGNITIHETEPGSLARNQQIWIGVEGGVSLAWGSADLISLSASTATVDANSGLQVGTIVSDQRGFWVEIVGESIDEPGTITFSGVQASGTFVAGNEWDIIVAGSAVADNFGVSAFTWDGPIFGGGTFTRIGHGLFTPEPYPTAALSFDGTDVFDPGVIAPPAPPTTQPPTTLPSATPVTLFQNQAYTIRAGSQAGQTIMPSFEMRAFGDGSTATAFIAAFAIGDILGWDASWDPTQQQGTFTMQNGQAIVFTNGSNQVQVGGQAMQMTQQTVAQLTHT